MNWVKAAYGISILLGLGACAVLDFREAAGVCLLIGSIMAWERARLLQWTALEEKRRVDEEARRLEAIAKMEADLKSRVPGQGREKYRQRAKPPRDEP